MPNKEDKLKKCVEYFKKKKGYRRFFQKLKENYLSLGRIGGTIRIRNLTKEERSCFSAFLHKNYYDKKSINLQVVKFKEALDKYTAFGGLDLKDILFAYYGGEILSKKERREIFKNKKETFFNNVISEFEGTESAIWIKDELETKSSFSNLLTKRYKENIKLLKKELRITMNAFNVLVNYIKDDKKERLPIFAAKITKNPHAFDESTSLNTLLTNGICYMLRKDSPRSAEDKKLLFYEAGIIKNELSNFTTLKGLYGYKDGKEYELWKCFRKNQEIFNANVLNINNIEKVDAPNKRVFVFENPGVFEEVVYRFQENDIGFMCTYGQIKYASFLILDMLVKEGVYIYYSGDFDPEGIRIADNLKIRYRNNLTLWKFKEEDYLNSISNKTISQDRLSKLKTVFSDELKAVANLIYNKEVAGYQELLIDGLEHDILNICQLL